MSKNARLSLVIIAVVAVLVTGFLVFNRTSTTAAPQPSGGGKITVVEYFDLECPPCRAAYPGVEKLRAEYGDRVTFTLKHFPLPMHRNAELAATAVEAAGVQGKRDEMIKVLFESQQEWRKQQTSQHAAFVGFAGQLGLDVPRFEASLTDPALLERVAQQREEGTKAGVRGTPTFFVNGTQFRSQPTYDALKGAIDSALGQ